MCVVSLCDSSFPITNPEIIKVNHGDLEVTVKGRGKTHWHAVVFLRVLGVFVEK
jgi:hypothetical protein